MPQEPFNPGAIIEQSSWHEMLEFVRDCTEEQAWALLAYEQDHGKRLPWINRFHQRANKLRGQRERRELAAKS